MRAEAICLPESRTVSNRSARESVAVSAESNSSVGTACNWASSFLAFRFTQLGVVPAEFPADLRHGEQGLCLLVPRLVLAGHLQTPARTGGEPCELPLMADTRAYSRSAWGRSFLQGRNPGGAPSCLFGAAQHLVSSLLGAVREFRGLPASNGGKPCQHRNRVGVLCAAGIRLWRSPPRKRMPPCSSCPRPIKHSPWQTGPGVACVSRAFSLQFGVEQFFGNCALRCPSPDIEDDPGCLFVAEFEARSMVELGFFEGLLEFAEMIEAGGNLIAGDVDLPEIAHSLQEPHGLATLDNALRVPRPRIQGDSVEAQATVPGPTGRRTIGEVAEISPHIESCADGGESSVITGACSE